MEMVSEDLIRAWEDAYRRYGSAAGANVAPASRAVAMAWRDIACTSRLPWWMLAAVESAAEAFEDQAEQWEARARQTAKSWSCRHRPGTKREPRDLVRRDFRGVAGNSAKRIGGRVPPPGAAADFGPATDLFLSDVDR